MSDVAGAFDRVCRERLLQKVEHSNLHPQLVKVFRARLEERIAYVIVNGQRSCPLFLNNMVFQGTVLGPLLWNIFFKDAGAILREDAFLDILFADDINGLRVYPGSTQDNFINADVKKVQKKLHLWGEQHRVLFDASKESHHILSRSRGTERNFKLLGVHFDTKLTMAPAIFECVSICNSKLQSLLRAKKYYTDADVLQLFKAHILSFIEYRTMAVAHAAPNLLDALNDILTRLLVRLGISHEVALMHFNLAPLDIRRDIAQLGLIHRTVLNKGPPHFKRFFPRIHNISGHNRSVYDPSHGSNAAYLRHSAFSLIGCYNRLPDDIANIDDVSNFQSELQDLVRCAINERNPFWRSVFRRR